MSKMTIPPDCLTDEFMLESFKIETCMLSHPHGWKVCPYVHKGEPARRRHYSKYLPDWCPQVKKGLRCDAGPEDCPWAHNAFEMWLHPARFKTQLCKNGKACKRPICFFAHTKEEVARSSKFRSSNSGNYTPVPSAAASEAVDPINGAFTSSIAEQAKPAAAAAAADLAAALESSFLPIAAGSSTSSNQQQSGPMPTPAMPAAGDTLLVLPERARAAVSAQYALPLHFSAFEQQQSFAPRAVPTLVQLPSSSCSSTSTLSQSPPIPYMVASSSTAVGSCSTGSLSSILDEYLARGSGEATLDTQQKMMMLQQKVEELQQQERQQMELIQRQLLLMHLQEQQQQQQHGAAAAPRPSTPTEAGLCLPPCADQLQPATPTAPAVHLSPSDFVDSLRGHAAATSTALLASPLGSPRGQWMPLY